jgi:pimeloyl-ACP methyl ester carboxylesterase
MFGEEHSGRKAAPSPILFVHGSLSSRHVWAPYQAALAGRRTLAIDLPGYGAQPGCAEEIPYRLTDAAAPISRTMASIDTVDIVAHSFGGAVALRYALENPARVRSLTLIEPSWFGVLPHLGLPGRAALRAIQSVARGFLACDPDQDRLFAMARFVDYWNGRHAWRELRVERQEILALKSDQVRRDFEAIFAERLPLAAFRKFFVSTLIVTGTTSPAAALLVAEGLARAAPRASLVSVPGAGHALPMTHVGDLTRILRARLEVDAAPIMMAA